MLVVGTDDWAIEQAAESLEAAGHTPLRCQSAGAAAFPCVGVLDPAQCPLVQGVDCLLDVRNRTSGELTALEVGVVCALHRGVPVVAAGMIAAAPHVQLAAAVVAEDQAPADVVGALDPQPSEHG